MTSSGIHQDATRPLSAASKASSLIAAGLAHLDQQDRALAPFGVGAPDHRGERHLGQRARRSPRSRRD